VVSQCCYHVHDGVAVVEPLPGVVKHDADLGPPAPLASLQGVTVVLQWCYSGVTVVLQWCYSGVTVVLQWCYSGVTVVLKWCYSGGTVL
jgi:hypothetical protein